MTVDKTLKMEPRIKSKLFRELNAKISQFDPRQDIRVHPKVHYGVNSNLIGMRHELFNIGMMDLQERRKKLWTLLRSDFLQEEEELRQVDLAYINTQP